MKRTEELLISGQITSMSVGLSALRNLSNAKKFFCNIRSAELEGNVQGHGNTPDEACDDAIAQMKRSLGHLHQTRPVTTTFQMPEPGKIRMPL